MQPRRRQDHITVPPTSRAQYRPELGSHPYRRTGRDGFDREMGHERNLNPRLQRSDGFERRDQGWHFEGRMNSQVNSRSPPFEQARKRQFFNDGFRRRSGSPPPVMRPRYEMAKTTEYYVDGENLVTNHAYGYDHVNSAVNREKDLSDSRLGGGPSMEDHKLGVNESEARGPFGLVPDTGITSQFKETDGHLPLLSRDVDIQRIEQGRQQHRDSLPSEKMPVTESYRHAEKPILHAPEVSRPTISPSYTKDYASSSQLRDRDHGSSSLGMPRSDMLSSHHNGNCLPDYYELPRGSGKLPEPVGYSGYGTRPRNIGQQRSAFSPSRTEQEEYLNSKLQAGTRPSRTEQEEYLNSKLQAGAGPSRTEQEEYLNSKLQAGAQPTRTEQEEYLNSNLQAGARPPRTEQEEYLNSNLQAGARPPRTEQEEYHNSKLQAGARPSRTEQEEYLNSKLQAGARPSRTEQEEYLNSKLQAGARPSSTEQEEYLNSKLQAGAPGEHVYQFDDLHRRVAPHGRLDHDHAQMEYNNREFPAPFSMNQVLDRNGKGEEHYGNYRGRSINDQPALQKPRYVDYPEMARKPISSKQHEEFLNSGYSHYESDKRMPREYEASYMAVSEAEQSSMLRLEYDSQRNRGAGLQQERFQSNPLTRHDPEAHGHAIRLRDMKQGLGIYDYSDRQLKRKYNADGMYLSDSRTIKSYEWDAREEYQDPYEDEYWIDDEEEMNVMYSSDNVGLDHRFYRKDNRQYNELYMVEDFPSDDWLPSQNPGGYAQRHTFRFRKYSNQNVKSHPRPNSSSWNKPQHFFRRNTFHKQPKVWKKFHGYADNVHTNDELSEDLTSATEPEPNEGSDEFNQKVQEAFLMYSKRLNVNSSVQRRYKEQGNAGSLFCIVCGRSASKEFLDTQRLVTHAFMSHKAGLRTQHLGLHKAICVLLGWDTVVPQDTVTWVPLVLPKTEALAQKEDLIIWPPLVVIHNVSMSDDNPQKWRVVTMETVEAFIRGKGFVRGRVKVSLGKPADQSVILVKFLGTFVGLGDAERLNNYLYDCKRGRLEFERIKSKTSRCSILDEDEIPDNKLEGILYGYMGIAEDLDKLDFNSKKRCIIKSRKEIEELDNDPVKTYERQ